MALQVLRARIAGITIANGYRTDLGAGVILTDRSELTLESQESVTLIVAGDIEDIEASSSDRIKNSDMDVTFECAIRFDSENTELVAHRARADIVRALAQPLSRDETQCFRSIALTGSRFAQDADEKGIPFTLAQVTARAGLTERFAPAQ
ncbi:hypothetical protein [Pseudoxanthomonas mexicana]